MNVRDSVTAADAARLGKLIAMETPDTRWILGDLGLLRVTAGYATGKRTVREALDAAPEERVCG